MSACFNTVTISLCPAPSALGSVPPDSFLKVTLVQPYAASTLALYSCINSWILSCSHNPHPSHKPEPSNRREEHDLFEHLENLGPISKSQPSWLNLWILTMTLV